MGLILGSGRSPGGGHGNSLVFLHGESHGQRSLVGYSPWSHRVRHDWVSEHNSPLYSCYYVYFLPHPLLSLGFKLPRSGPLLSLLLAPMAEVLKIQENWSKTVCWITWVFNSDSSIVGQFWSWHISSLTHSHCWDGLPRKQQRPCKSPWRSDLPRDFWNNFTQNKK